MRQSGYADLPLHYGQVPPWLYERMSKLGVAIVEAIVTEYGTSMFLAKMSDPFWFQSLGCVLGMDWHSSGITTSVMGALKKSVNERSKDLGIYICGGKGKFSRETPSELLRIANATGLDGNELIKSSKLTAKVDNTAIQDGFNLYLHSFILTNSGEWAVVQQGMNDQSGLARRYHWHSLKVESFVNNPHSSIFGKNQGLILNMTDVNAESTRNGVVEIAIQQPDKMMKEIQKLVMPSHHELKEKDVNLKRLGSVLALAHENQIQNFESLLMLQGLGPRTLQSLVLVSEVIHGTPSRFTDPARFSLAHGGKDGHPFPVPTKVYDETISVLSHALEKARIGRSEKVQAIKKLSEVAQQMEKDFIPNKNFNKVIEQERTNSYKYGGKTVFGDASPPIKKSQLTFDF